MNDNIRYTIHVLIVIIFISVGFWLCRDTDMNIKMFGKIQILMLMNTIIAGVTWSIFWGVITLGQSDEIFEIFAIGVALWVIIDVVLLFVMTVLGGAYILFALPYTLITGASLW